MRVMIGPVEIAGIAAGLKEQFDELGTDAEVVLSYPHPYSFGTESTRVLARLWSRLGYLYHFRTKNLPRPLRLPGWAMWKAMSVLVWVWALIRFDAFIFLFSQTITNSRLEARLYSLLRKRVIMIYCGSDVRPPYIDGPTSNNFGTDQAAKVARLAGRIQRKVRLHEESGFICVNAPVTAQFQSRPYVNWFAMGIPRTARRAAESEPGNSLLRDGAVRIVHSPSDPQTKGTAHIVHVIEKLKSEGHNIDFVLLSGVSNDRIHSELGRCDFVIDQLWSDSPMAGLVTEAAHHGKPAIVAGYAASAHYQLFQSSPPTAFVYPDHLEIEVRRFLADPALRGELGRRAQDFVQGEWAPDKVAQRYLSLLEEGAPSSFLLPASAHHYTHGFGLSEDRAREMMRAVLTTCGPEGLHLDHDPELLQAFLDFAGAGLGPQVLQ